MVTRHYPHTQKAVSVSCDGWINIACSMGATIHLRHRRSVHLECVAVETVRFLACEHLLHIHVTFYDYIKIAFLNVNWIYTYIKTVHYLWIVICLRDICKLCEYLQGYSEFPRLCISPPTPSLYTLLGILMWCLSNNGWSFGSQLLWRR